MATRLAIALAARTAGPPGRSGSPGPQGPQGPPGEVPPELATIPDVLMILEAYVNGDFAFPQRQPGVPVANNKVRAWIQALTQQ